MKRLFFILSLPLLLTSAEIELSKICKFADSWISRSTVFKAEAPHSKVSTVLQFSAEDNSPLPLASVAIEPKGYLIMSLDDRLPPVIAFSTSENLSPDTSLAQMFIKQATVFKSELTINDARFAGQYAKNKERWNDLLEEETRGNAPETIIIPNLLSTVWHQDFPFNYFCPSSISNDAKRTITGCVPIAAAQLMNYYQWPPYGEGEKTCTINTEEIKYIRNADFSLGYDWELIGTNAFSQKTDITKAGMEVARLLSDLGVLFGTSYGFSDSSTSSFEILRGLHSNMQYEQGEYLSTNGGLYNKLKESILAKQPAVVCYYSGNSGHAFLATGLATENDQDFYYLNYGWSEGVGANGWFTLDNCYEGNVISEGIVGIIPKKVPVFKRIYSPQLPDFTIAWDFPKHYLAEGFKLTVSYTGKKSIIIDENIPGDARTYQLKAQPDGVASYSICAKVNGEWQEFSEVLNVSISKSDAKPISIASTVDSINISSGKDYTLKLKTTSSASSLSVFSDRQDLFPEDNVTVEGKDLDWNITISPVSGLSGNAHLIIIATSAEGSKDMFILPVSVSSSDKHFWFRNLNDAVKEASSSGKNILVAAGRDTDQNTTNFRLVQCEISSNKAIIEKRYVLWYADCDNDKDFKKYVVGKSYYLPLIGVISPFNTNEIIRFFDGPQSDSYVSDFISYIPEGSITIPEDSKELDTNDQSDSTIGIISDSDWHIECNDDDVTVDVTDGKGNANVNITIGKNPLQTKRTVSVAIYSGEVITMMYFTQPASGPYMDIPENATFSAFGGTQQLKLSASVNWIASCNDCDWLSLPSPSGTRNTPLTLLMESNMTNSERSAVISFTGEGVESRQCLITQRCTAQDATPTEMFTFYTSKGKQYINKYVGTNEYVCLPTENNGKPVYSLYDNGNNTKSASFISNQYVKRAIIPEPYPNIPAYTFYNSTLEEVAIPSTVTSIGYGAFLECNNLRTFIVANDNPVYETDGHLLISKTDKQVVAYTTGSLNNSITIPEVVETINGGVFNNSRNLDTVIMQEGVISIKKMAFQSILNLRHLTFPTSLESIGEEAFSYTWEISSLTLPPRLKSLGPHAFQYALLYYTSSVTIPAGIKTIGEGAFDVYEPIYSNKSISSIYFDGPAPEDENQKIINVNIPIYVWPGFGWEAGERFGGTVTILDGKEPPKISRNDGLYTEPANRSTTITISTLSDCELRYTIDGTTPTMESIYYSEPFEVTYLDKAFKGDIHCIQARYFKNGQPVSGVTFLEFVINPPQPRQLTVNNGTGSGLYQLDSDVTVEAELMDNLSFSYWSSDDMQLSEEQSLANPMTFVMPDNDVTITANYSEKLVWHRNLGNAVEEAIASGQNILMAVGRDEDAATNNFRLAQCEYKPNKDVINQRYVLWYADFDNDNDCRQIIGEEEFELPFVGIVSPFDTQNCIRSFTGPQTNAFVHEFLTYIPEGSLELSADSINLVANEKTETSIDIISDSAWKIAIFEDDIMADVSEGSGYSPVKITISKNTMMTERSTAIAVYSGELIKLLRITQPSSGAFVDIPAEVSFDAFGGDKQLEITASVTWYSSCDDCEWLALTTSTGSQHSLLTMSLQPNLTDAERTAIITITAEGLEDMQCIVTQTCTAQDITPDELFEFVVIDDKIYISKYTGSNDYVCIPTEHNGEPIYAIGTSDGSFKDNTTVKKVIIPEPYNSIHDNTFSNSTLSGIIMPVSIMSIGNDAFFNCASLNYVVVPEGVIYIGKRAFSKNSSLQKISFPSTLEDIDEEAFSYSENMKVSELPPRLKSIGPRAFQYAFMHNTDSIAIPAGIKNIGEGAFEIYTEGVFDNSLKAIYFDGPAPEDENVFLNVDLPIYVWPGFGWQEGKRFGGTVILLDGKEPPVISRDDGLYDEPVDARTNIAISTLEDCEVHFTVDGSAPTINSPVYTAPFEISYQDKAFANGIHCIQARYFQNGEPVSGVAFLEVVVNVPTAWQVTVVNGTGSGIHKIGSDVTVEATLLPTELFQSWSCTGLLLTDEQLSANPLTFVMPDNEVTLTAVASDKLFWFSNLNDALNAAQDYGKNILMATGNDTSDESKFFRLEQCEYDDNKDLIKQKFVLWHADSESDYQQFVDEAEYSQPYVAVISPYGKPQSIRHFSGSQEDEYVHDFLAFVPEYNLSLSAEYINLETNENTETSFDITSDVSWNILCYDDDVLTDASEGNGNATVNVSIGKNTLQAERTATIVIYSGELIKLLNIVQPPSDKYMDIPADAKFGAIGGTNQLTISASVIWNASCDDCDWLSITTPTGTQNSPFEFILEPNLSNTERTAIVTFVADGIESAQCMITQTSAAQEATPDEMFEFDTEDGNLVISKYIGTDENVCLPTEHNGEPIYAIGKNKGLFSFNDVVKKVIIPEPYQVIPDNAFISSSVETIVIPSSLLTIEDDAFLDCSNLKSFVIAKDNPMFATDDNILTSKEEKQIIAYTIGSPLTSITIPENIVSIADKAFKDACNITDVSMSEGLVSIGKRAFYNASSLHNITFPTTLESIGDEAFSYTSNLASLALPPRIRQIGVNAFQFSLMNNACTITIPASIKTIGEGAFFSKDDEIQGAIEAMYFDGPAPEIANKEGEVDNQNSETDTRSDFIDDRTPKEQEFLDIDIPIYVWPGFGWEEGKRFGGTVIILDGVEPPQITRADEIPEEPADGFATIAISTIDDYEVRYTVDGTTPKADSALYTNPFETSYLDMAFNENIHCIQARYFQNGQPASGVAIMELPINRPSTWQVTVNNGTGTGLYKIGSEVTVEAELPDTELFTNWSSNDLELSEEQSLANPMTFIMPEHEVTITANSTLRTLSFDTDSISTGYKKCTASLVITCNDKWTLNSSEDWIALSQADGTGNSEITLEIADNELTAERHAVITATAFGCEPVTCTVTQVASPDFQRLPALPGWHLITLCIAPDEESTDFFNSIAPFVFNGTSGCYEHTYSPFAPGQTYAIFLTDDFVKMNPNPKLYGIPLENETMAKPDTKGWHLLGPAIGEFAIPDWASSVWQLQNGKYTLVRGNLEKARAYWILTTK